MGPVEFYWVLVALALGAVFFFAVSILFLWVRHPKKYPEVDKERTTPEFDRWEAQVKKSKEELEKCGVKVPSHSRKRLFVLYAQKEKKSPFQDDASCERIWRLM